jgi:hypothetical protein
MFFFKPPENLPISAGGLEKDKHSFTNDDMGPVKGIFLNNSKAVKFKLLSD